MADDGDAAGSPSGGPPLRRVFAPGRIGGLALPHRIVMGAMHLGTEGRPGGADLAAFYAARARGGAGLMITGGSAVSRAGAGGASYGFVNEAAGADALAAVVAAVHAEGGTVALQLFHAGRYAVERTFGVAPVAPSPLPSRRSRAIPRALDDAGIAEIVDQFAAGATRARALGFDAIEIMGSEGYLVDQFLSPLTNHRDDDWGGDARRRMRFGVELTRAVRAAAGPDLPVIVRFTGADLMPGGVADDAADAFARALVAAGADALNVGIGWHESPIPTVQGAVPSGAWIEVARRVKRVVGPAMPVIAGNRVDDVALADALLTAGGVDFISMARPFLADPDLIARTRAGQPVNPCIACNQACIDRSLTDARVSCMTNPRAGHERELAGPGRRRLARVPRVGVIGGGPAGLEAARALAQLGARVDLFEAEAELGGQFRLARLVPGKERYGATITALESELERLGVTVHLGGAIDAADLRPLAELDAIVLASGVRPRRPVIPGVEQAIAYPEAFTEPLGARVAIVGAGGIGVDLAHRLSHRATRDPLTAFRADWGLDGAPPAAPVRSPRAVTITRRDGRIGAGMGRTTRWVSLAALRRAGVEQLTGVTYERIDADGLHLRTDDGPRTIVADTVVLASGQEPRAELAAPLAALGRPLRVIGGAADADGLDAVRAFREGLDAARALGALLGLHAAGGSMGDSAVEWS